MWIQKSFFIIIIFLLWEVILYRLQMEPHGFIDGFSGIGCGGLLQEVKDHPCPGFSMQLRFKYSSELL